MTKVAAASSTDHPGFAAWVKATVPNVTNDPELWAALLSAAGVPAPIARDAIRGGILSPTLVVADEIRQAARFNPADPSTILVDRRLAVALDAAAPSDAMMRLALIAILSQAVAWLRFRNGASDFMLVSQEFASRRLGHGLQAVFLDLVEPNRRLAIRITEQDREDMIKLTIAEAGGKGTRQGRMGQAGVIFVVLNRLASGRFAKSIRAVIDAPSQFEPVLKAPGQSITGLRPPPGADSAEIGAIIDDIIDSKIDDPTNGATFFQNVKITQERGTDFARGVAPTAIIVDHSFYDRFKANDPVVVPPWRAERA